MSCLIRDPPFQQHTPTLNNLLGEGKQTCPFPPPFQKAATPVPNVNVNIDKHCPGRFPLLASTLRELYHFSPIVFSPAASACSSAQNGTLTVLLFVRWLWLEAPSLSAGGGCQ